MFLQGEKWTENMPSQLTNRHCSPRPCRGVPEKINQRLISFLCEDCTCYSRISTWNLSWSTKAVFPAEVHRLRDCKKRFTVNLKLFPAWRNREYWRNKNAFPCKLVSYWTDLFGKSYRPIGNGFSKIILRSHDTRGLYSFNFLCWFSIGDRLDYFCTVM